MHRFSVVRSVGRWVERSVSWFTGRSRRVALGQMGGDDAVNFVSVDVYSFVDGSLGQIVAGGTRWVGRLYQCVCVCVCGRGWVERLVG